MGTKTPAPAIEGWYSMDKDHACLLGARCTDCGTYYFPKHIHYCRNPGCDSESFEEVELSTTGTLWSYTNACYPPPEPFVAADPFEPFAIAAVELEREKMIVLGQVVAGVDVSELAVGAKVELVLDTLHEDEEHTRMVWKWKPVAAGA